MPAAIMGFSADDQRPLTYCTTNTAVVVDTTLPAVAAIVTV